MVRRYPYGEPVTVIDPAVVVDPFSNEETANDWASATETTYDDCAVAPRTTEETNDAGQTMHVVTGLTIYGPPGMKVGPVSRVRARGQVWEVDGDVADWQNPFSGWHPGLSFDVRKVSG